jgi:hypothetical protein
MFGGSKVIVAVANIEFGSPEAKGVSFLTFRGQRESSVCLGKEPAEPL